MSAAMESKTDAGPMSDEIDRLVRQYRQMGYSRAAICSMSFDIEELAAKNLSEEQETYGRSE